MKGRKKAQTLRNTHVLWAVILVTFVIMMALTNYMISITVHGQHDTTWNSPRMLTGSDGSLKSAKWKFTDENIEKDHQLRKMLSKFLMNRQSLTTLRIASPGVSGTTQVDFFGTNPGWLSRRTFTADVFTCPPNSHEGISFEQISTEI